jgi:glycolate oxidase
MLADSTLQALRDAIGERHVLVADDELRTYECDGLTNFRVVPLAVLLPASTAEVQAVVRICHHGCIPFVARGAGTGMSGGALPVSSGVVISLARMNRILEVDVANRRVVVEPGVINAHVSDAVAGTGLFYAPDPSSQPVCTIGGNVAENSGGAHCLQYGFTVNHVLGLEVVLPDGEIVWLGGEVPETPGYDLAGVFVGSEGTLGVATKVVLRLTHRPENIQTMLAAFESADHAGGAVSGIIAARLLPAAIEFMDPLSIHATEAAVGAGYPECGGLLIIEVDGVTEEVAEQMQLIESICKENGASEVRVARSDAERALLWKGRKAAFAAMGRLATGYLVQDGVIPRSALARVLARIDELSQAAGLRVANVFHAGDGNLHPIVLFDRDIEAERARAEALAFDILRLCVEAGGSITGEHGVGREKRDFMPVMYAEPDLDTMQRVRCAFDPQGLANPGKIFPRPRLCAETPGVFEAHSLEKGGIAERM